MGPSKPERFGSDGIDVANTMKDTKENIHRTVLFSRLALAHQRIA